MSFGSPTKNEVRETPAVIVDFLVLLGSILDHRDPNGITLRDLLIAAWLKVRARDGALRPLIPNAAQRAYARRCGQRNIILKARQLGMTTYVAARFFIDTITRPGTLTVQVAHDQRSAEEIFRIVHRFLENVPEPWRSALKTSRANVRQLVFPLLDSEYRVETAADPNAGRGLTIQNLHCSEVARWSADPAETLGSLRAAVPPHGTVVLESTPSGAAGAFYDEWMRADDSGYVRHFFPWWMEAAYARAGMKLATLSDEERDLQARHGLTDAQVAFRREIAANFRRLARQEFAEDAASCFLASGECVFDVDAIERRLAETVEPQSWRDSRRVAVWLPPANGRSYIIGVDPAGGGVDGDFAAAQVIDRRSGLQCAELHGHLAPRGLATAVSALAREYNGALIAVERNNHGHAVLAHLAMSDATARVYECGGQPGFLTNVATRPRMIERMAALLVAEPQLFASRGLLEECRAFVRRADGTAAAASGAHDDRVMAMAIALEVREITVA